MLTSVPKSEALVLGVASLRDALLPLLSLRGLLGLSQAREQSGREKVVVVRVAGGVVGLVADRMLAIVPADDSRMEPIPEVLAARTGGESRIKAIYRGEGGRRLISVLETDGLFGDEVMRKLDTAREANVQPAKASALLGETAQFVVFRLGDEEFGLPIEVVDEVARVPTQVARVPKAPKFLEGVINLRGDVLPVIDQRQRFGMDKSPDSAARRLIVVRTGQHRAGVIVDSVSEVLRHPADAIEAAPTFSTRPSCSTVRSVGCSTNSPRRKLRRSAPAGDQGPCRR
jgi:purine-binding chemotaxis protein CheW